MDRGTEGIRRFSAGSTISRMFGELDCGLTRATLLLNCVRDGGVSLGLGEPKDLSTEVCSRVFAILKDLRRETRFRGKLGSLDPGADHGDPDESRRYPFR